MKKLQNKTSAGYKGALLCTLFLSLTLIWASAFASTSTIIVTSSPFLSFTNVPEPVLVGSLNVPTTDTPITSDADGFLPSERFITIRDTRGCGGLNLQLQADNFTPATSPELKNNLRIITSVADLIDAPVVNGIKYFSGFTGDQNIVAPLNVAGTNFSDPTLFTNAPFDTVDNTLDTPLDLMQGNLTAPAGRNGQMHLDVSFYLLVPKLMIPAEYFTTLTFTLSDDTAGVC